MLISTSILLQKNIKDKNEFKFGKPINIPDLYFNINKKNLLIKSRFLNYTLHMRKKVYQLLNRIPTA